MNRLLARLLLFLVTTGSLFAGLPDGFVQGEWSVQGAQRTALLRIPKNRAGRMPVVFCWHGHGGTAEHAVRAWGFPAEWPDALLVYPQGLPTPGQLTDPEGRRTGWQAGPGAQNDRDLAFFDALLATLRAEHPVDEDRIYSTGHSNGGGFTYLLWAQRPESLAAIAPVAGALGRTTKPLKPMPVLHVAGRNDPLVRFAWQEATFAAVRALNQCAAMGSPWDRSGAISAERFESRKGAPLVAAVHPGGHEYPGGTAKLIVKFFKEHARGHQSAR